MRRKEMLSFLVLVWPGWVAGGCNLVLFDFRFVEDANNISDDWLDRNMDEEEPLVIPEFVPIEHGKFVMGSPDGEMGRDDDEDQHQVTLTVSFEMMKHEVTQREFYSLMGRNPSSFSSCDDCPVERVNWHEALEYANALSVEVGMDECFKCVRSSTADVVCTLKEKYLKPQDCRGYRLPTEAEWEYAARAASTTAFYKGDIEHTGCGSPAGSPDPQLDAIGWYCGNSGNRTHRCGEKEQNNWGLLDMSGNVWEWVWDWYGNYPAADSDVVTDQGGPKRGEKRVVRGGSWNSHAHLCRSASRHSLLPDTRSDSVGFRLVRSLGP